MSSLPEPIDKSAHAPELPPRAAFSPSAHGALQLASLDGISQLPKASDDDAFPLPDTASSALRSLSVIIAGLLEAVIVVDARSLQVVEANAQAIALCGTTRRRMLSRSALEFAATPEDACFWADPAEQRDSELLSDSLVVRDDGTVVPVTRRIKRVDLDDECWLLVSMRDRSEQQRVENELERFAAELAATLESTADGLLATDLAGRICGFNRRFAELWGLPEDLLARRDDAAIGRWIEQRIAMPLPGSRPKEAGKEQGGELFRLTDGRTILRVTVQQRSRGAVIGRVHSFRDVTDQLAARERIETMSLTDALTGLPNRRLLDERMSRELAAARRRGGHFATLFVDLDRFKQINDSFGHACGDQVLIETTARLKSALREIDTVSRPGGDEFVLIVHEAAAEGAEAAARRIMDEMSRPFTLDGTPFTVTCSIGVALYPEDGEDVETLLRSADMAMYEAKSLGRSAFCFHRPGGNEDLRTRVRLDHAMRQGLAAGHFSLRYQPQVELATGRTVGAEALLRWLDPQLGEIPPQEFLAVAGESGFVVQLGEWALRESVAQAARWHAQGKALPVCVNIAAPHFHRENFVDDVAGLLQHTGLPAKLLELEFTEAILIKDAQRALAVLQRLAALGVELSIDDFGTGYSSLAYLRRFPIHRLKIDASFVHGAMQAEGDAAIVRAIIDLARSLGLKVLAEGVETLQQKQFLIEAGCDEYQGFLRAPALTPHEFDALRQRG